MRSLIILHRTRSISRLKVVRHFLKKSIPVNKYPRVVTFTHALIHTCTHTHIYVTRALGGMDGEVVLVGSRECGRLWGWPVADWCALTTWTYNSRDDMTYFSSYLYLDHTRDSVPGSGADVTSCWSPGRSMYTRSNPESPFSQPRWANWLPSVNKLQKQSESFYFVWH